jgi:uncharacterized OB-fold protein
MSMSEYRKPVPVASLESKPYWEGIRQHRLLLPRCAACGRTWFPPSHLCPRCGSGDVGWAQSSGRGKVFSYVVFHRAYHPGFADDVPYAVALVELEEGPRLLGNVIGVPPDQVACEMPVRVVFEDVADGVTLPRFAVVEA